MIKTRYEVLVEKLKEDGKIKGIGVERSQEINNKIKEELDKFKIENEIKHVKSVELLSKVIFKG